MLKKYRSKKNEYIISANHSLFDLKLNDVWKYRDLLLMFVERDFKTFYKQTVLGPIWFFIQPIFTMSVYIFIFGNLAELSTEGTPQSLFYLTGIIPWSYFSECLTKTSTVFKDQVGILSKVYFPRVIMPLTIIISNLLRFGVQLILLIVIMMILYFSEGKFTITPYILFFPFLIILLGFLGMGLGMIISAMTTKYRDLIFLINFGVQLLMYGTTVVYPLSSLEGKWKTVIALNPITHIIEGTRKGFLGVGSFDFYSFLILCASTVLIFILGLIIFNKVERDFIDTI